MARSTIVVGNGIGLGLDPEYFRLGTGLRTVWNDTAHLTAEHKNLILSAIKGTTASQPPENEDQLDILQFAIIATEFLCHFEVGGSSWVSEPAKELPSAFKKYIHEVACYFFRSGHTLPAEFVDSLAAFIVDTKSHIVTLNYDSLLYDALLRTKILDGFSGPLIDGFLRNGFSPDNLVRYRPNQQGWYLHLHGSPLYTGNMKASGLAGRAFLEPSDQCHVVLSHVKHKPAIIASSPILSEYWERFAEALNESERIYLFGYSGNDPHVNNLINLHKNEKELTIIEWYGAGQHLERYYFWSKQIEHDKFNLYLLDDILLFTEW